MFSNLYISIYIYDLILNLEVSVCNIHIHAKNRTDLCLSEDDEEDGLELLLCSLVLSRCLSELLDLCLSDDEECL